MEIDKELIAKYSSTLMNIIEKIEYIPRKELDNFLAKYSKEIIALLVYVVQNLDNGTEKELEVAAITAASFFYFEGKTTQ